MPGVPATTRQTSAGPPGLDAFAANAFLDAGREGHVASYRPGDTLFMQGDPADTVLYVRDGRVKLSLTSATGKEAVVGILGSGDFCGEGALAARFISHMLARNRRLEEDLVDQMLNTSEQRLARALLLLAGSGRKPRGPRLVLRPIPQEILAEMIGTTRSRVNLFMNRFRRRGYIEYGTNSLIVHDTLRDVVLREPVSHL